MSSPKKPKPAIEKEESPKKGKKKRDTGRAADLPGLHGEPIPSAPGKSIGDVIDEANAKPVKGSRSSRRAERRAARSRLSDGGELLITGAGQTTSVKTRRDASKGTVENAEAVTVDGPPAGEVGGPPGFRDWTGERTVQVVDEDGKVKALETTTAGAQPGGDLAPVPEGESRPYGEPPSGPEAGPEGPAPGDTSGEWFKGDGAPLARVGDAVDATPAAGVLGAGDEKPVRVKAENAGALGLQLTEDQIRRANEHGAVYARINGGPYFYKVEGESEARWHKRAPVLHEVVSPGPRASFRGVEFPAAAPRRERPPVDFGSLSLADAMNALEAARDLTDAVDESFDLPIAEGVPRLRAALDGARAAGILPPPGRPACFT